jgi:hypothetical protein
MNVSLERLCTASLRTTYLLISQGKTEFRHPECCKELPLGYLAKI